RTQYQQLLDDYHTQAAALAEGRALLESKKGELDAGAAQLTAGWAEYNSGLASLEAGKRALEESKKTLDEGWAMLADKQLELTDAQRQIEDGRQKLADARLELDDARALIAENKQKLLDGEMEYADAKAEVDEKLADARRELEDGERELGELKYPEWYVWDRSQNVSFSSFDANVEKLQAITTIFPIFFFLVAALVVSTTMTRMIEEERLQIGTMKALGYTQTEIMRKYLCYAAVAAVAGSVLGLAVGFFAFPTIIWSAYQIMYYMPGIATPWLMDKVIFAGGSLILLTVGITALACRQSLAEVPAALMLARAPKAGKRILLERIGPLWRRMPFIWKVTFRNLLRYKKRFWMTVIGVAGCTALLVTGFGISDSLDSIITNQYDRVYHYDLTTAVASSADTASGEVYEYLFGPDFDASLATCTEKISQHTAAGKSVDCYLTIPRDTTAFADFADLHERVSGKPVPLGEQGVVLTEKFASIMGVKAGDTVTLENADGIRAVFSVTGVCEHYVYNYVYMSAATYREGFGTEPSWNCILTRLPENSQPVRDAVSARLLAMDAVQGISFTVDQMTTVLNMLGSIDSVVALIIACAAALAFVVLYNLSNINIAERVKEIATIKVLGFYDREVDSYVNRESVALTLIGALVGLVLGIWLHRFIIVTVEVDAVMFGRDIAPRSFLYALALTLLFGTVVNLVMGRRLRRISMV
ncbi:MAG: FtsX-like permease family protein, partial [Gemmiger sp.]